jgi:hypothetical protein
MTIDGETVTFRDGRWCCTCPVFTDTGTCQHELEAIARALEQRAKPR